MKSDLRPWKNNMIKVSKMKVYNFNKYARDHY